MGASMTAANFAYDVGKSCFDTAKGRIFVALIFVSVLFLSASFLLSFVFYFFPSCTCLFVDTVASTVDSSKNAAQSTFDYGKSYVDSAKGNF